MFNYGASHACITDDGWVGLCSIVGIFIFIECYSGKFSKHSFNMEICRHSRCIQLFVP